MPTKSQQIQIRVTPQQKRRLKRLALEAGQDISSYVLGRALPGQRDHLEALLDALRQGSDTRFVLAELSDLLSGLSPDEWRDVVELPLFDWQGLEPWLRNSVAAMVERASFQKGLALPAWVEWVPPLPRPHFMVDPAYPNRYLLRVSPVPFKRRNLFVDRDLDMGPVVGPARSPGRPREALQRLFEQLEAEFAAADVEGEIVQIGGAVMGVVYGAGAEGAEGAADFRPPALIGQAAARVAAREGLSATWLTEAVATCLRPQPGASAFYLDRVHLRIFTCPPAYLLAVRCAAWPAEQAGGDLNEIRYLLRYMNIERVEEALAVVARYVDEADLLAEIGAMLEGLEFKGSGSLIS